MEDRDINADFINICRIYVTVDAQETDKFKISEAMHARMKLLIQHYKNPDQFYLYYDELNEYLKRCIRFYKLDMSKFTPFSG